MPTPTDTATIIFPPGSPFPPVAEQWRLLPNGEMCAWYTLEQLAVARDVADAITQRPPPLTPLDAILRRYDSYGYPWLLRE